MSDDGRTEYEMRAYLAEYHSEMTKAEHDAYVRDHLQACETCKKPREWHNVAWRDHDFV